MNDFRGPQPLDDRDFAEVRRNVMAKLERRSVAPIVLRFALAAAALIVLAIIFYPRPQPTIAKPPVAIHQAVPVVAPQTPPPVKIAKKAPVKPHRKPEQLVASTGGPPPDSDITMNIQTADPDVRIIWIAQR